ncbi:MerR family transcriptional regulator [Actinomadura keratinilytica]
MPRSDHLQDPFPGVRGAHRAAAHPSGYRKFSPQDIERLAQVLRMQRDHYLPLKVIKEHLDAVERGEEYPLPGVG